MDFRSFLPAVALYATPSLVQASDPGTDKEWLAFFFVLAFVPALVLHLACLVVFVPLLRSRALNSLKVAYGFPISVGACAYLALVVGQGLFDFWLAHLAVAIGFSLPWICYVLLVRKLGTKG